jgi:hypothetical protein
MSEAKAIALSVESDRLLFENCDFAFEEEFFNRLNLFFSRWD